MDYLHKKETPPPLGKPKYLNDVVGEVWEAVIHMRHRVNNRQVINVTDMDELSFRMQRLEHRITAYAKHRYELGKEEPRIFD
jgi:hypothetical protein